MESGVFSFLFRTGVQHRVCRALAFSTHGRLEFGLAAEFSPIFQCGTPPTYLSLGRVNRRSHPRKVYIVSRLPLWHKATASQIESA